MSRLEVTAGKSIYYEHYRGDGPAVVLVHGWGMGVRIWDLTLPVLLDAGHEVVALDHRCCGRSDKDFDEVSTSHIASDVVDLIAETGVSKPIVLGWSFGAAVVAEVAITLGSALGGILLVGPPTPRYLQADDFAHGGTAEIMEQTLVALRDTRPEFLHALAEGVCHQDVGNATIEWMWQMFMETSPACRRVARSPGGRSITGATCPRWRCRRSSAGATTTRSSTPRSPSARRSCCPTAGWSRSRSPGTRRSWRSPRSSTRSCWRSPPTRRAAVAASVGELSQIVLPRSPWDPGARPYLASAAARRVGMCSVGTSRGSYSRRIPRATVIRWTSSGPS